MKSLRFFFLILLAGGGVIWAGSADAACEFHNLTGYVWSRASGWVSLNCSGVSPDIDYGLDIDFESGAAAENVTGYAWSSNMGWLNFQPTGPYPASPAHAALFERNSGGSPTTTAGVITGWAKWEALGADGWMLLGPINIGGTDYGIGIGSDRLFSGWSWNGGSNIDGDADLERGDGWVYWDSAGSGGGASVLAYWFESLYGSLYSGGNLGASFAPPPGRYNATYLLQANGTINPVTITSEGGTAAPYRAEGFDALTLPNEANSYRGTAGKLDRAGMINGYYGPVTTYAGEQTTSATIGTSLVLGGNIYHYTGNLTVNSAITFNQGAGGGKANGTILVDGNLTINANTFYQAGAVTGNIRSLPAAAWIVKGNITINPAVRDAVGVFYSEGAIATGTTGSSLTDVPIAISGMLIAKTLNLERVYVDESHAPAEVITFDGRAAANPPPGLADMIKGMPSFREVRP